VEWAEFKRRYQDGPGRNHYRTVVLFGFFERTEFTVNIINPSILGHP
jgi:hypothetical protein